MPHKIGDVFRCYIRVLGTLLSQSLTSRMSGVVCLPEISADDVRVHFLSFATDRRKEIEGMLGGAALFTMLYEKYPCPGETLLRRTDAEATEKELSQKYHEK